MAAMEEGTVMRSGQCSEIPTVPTGRAYSAAIVTLTALPCTGCSGSRLTVLTCAWSFEVQTLKSIAAMRGVSMASIAPWLGSAGRRLLSGRPLADYGGPSLRKGANWRTVRLLLTTTTYLLFRPCSPRCSLLWPCSRLRASMPLPLTPWCASNLQRSRMRID